MNKMVVVGDAVGDNRFERQSAVQTDELSSSFFLLLFLFFVQSRVFLTQSSGFSLALQQGQNVSFTHGSFHVSDQWSVAFVQKFDLDLGTLTGGSGTTQHFGDASKCDLVHGGGLGLVVWSGGKMWRKTGGENEKKIRLKFNKKCHKKQRERRRWEQKPLRWRNQRF